MFTSEELLIHQRIMNIAGVENQEKVRHTGYYCDVWTATRNSQPVVVKVSSDTLYFKPAERVMRYPSPLLARVLFLTKLPSGFGYYSHKVLAVEEYLDPLAPGEEAVLDVASDVMEQRELRPVFGQASRYAHNCITPARLRKLIDFMRADPEDIGYKWEASIIEVKLLPIAESLQKRGLLWFDFHSGNIRKRGNLWVLSDLGMCWVRKRCPWVDGTAQETPIPRYCMELEEEDDQSPGAVRPDDLGDGAPV